MSAIGNWLKPLGQIGASFIPGVGGLIGAGIGAIGSGGKQGGVNFSSTGKQDIDEMQQAIEPEYWSQFRQSLIPQFMKQMEEFDKPVFGPEQKASHFQDIDDLTQSGLKGIRNLMSASGRGRSGAMDEALGELGMDNARQKIGFMNNLPFMEAEAKFNRMMPMLQLGAGWAGQAPVSTHTTGSRTLTQGGTQSQQGPSFMRSFMSGLGGMMGYGQKGPIPTLGQQFPNIFGRKPNPNWQGDDYYN